MAQQKPHTDYNELWEEDELPIKHFVFTF